METLTSQLKEKTIEIPVSLIQKLREFLSNWTEEAYESDWNDEELEYRRTLNELDGFLLSHK